MSMLVVLFIVGLRPSGRVEPGRPASAERVGEVLADGVRDAECVGLALEEADRVGPVPGGGEVLVWVRATTVSRTDCQSATQPGPLPFRAVLP